MDAYDQSALVRLERRVTAHGECRLVSGCRSDGYVTFFYRGRTDYAHLVAYGILTGPIPPGFDVHHLCERRNCIAQQHLEAVPIMVHHQRHEKALCKQGHLMSGANLYLHRWRGGGVARECRACKNETNRRYRERKARMV